MAGVVRSQALSAELWWFQFSSDIDMASALGRQKYSFQGADETWLKVLQVYLGDTADSVFVKTSPATDQEYTATFTGFLDLSGDIIQDIIYSLMPRIMPAYPPEGIIDLSVDGEGWGARMRAATEHWEKLTGINGYAGALVYPFVHSQENPSIYELDTSQLPEPVDELAIRPIVAPGHENDFTPDQIADLVVPVAAPRHPPEFTNLRLHNPARPWDDTITIIDGIIVFGEVGGWWKYRGMELMIARLGDPEDLLEILPYYPPGANDPNSPNYDPEAPPDGSANPPWWAKPIPPEKRPFYPWERDKPPAVELLAPGDLDPGFALPCPYAPPERVMPPITVPFPLMNLSGLGLPAGDHTIIARIYNEANDYSERTLPLRVEVPVDVPHLGAIGQIERNLGIIEGNEPGTYGIDQPYGTVTGGKVTLMNRSGQSFSGTLHIPTNGGQNDVALSEDPPGSNTHKADVSGQDLPSINTTLEFALGGGDPVSVNFPLFETREEVHVYGLTVTDSDGQVPEEIDPVRLYRVEGALSVSGGMSRFRLKGKYRGASGRVGESVFEERSVLPGSVLVPFVFDFEGSDIIEATGGPTGIDSRWFALEAYNFLGHWVEAGETLPIPEGVWSDDLQAVVSEGVQAYIDSGAVYGDGGKLPPEQINPASTNPQVRGVDCSGFVFNILDRALKKLKPETGGLASLWERDGAKRTHTETTNEYSSDYWGYPLGNDPNLWNYVDDDYHDNPKVGDLQPGDILHYNGGQSGHSKGHYEIVENVENNPDGTKNVVIAHSNGSLGPHRYRLENVSSSDRLKKVTESHYKDSEGNQAPHNEYTTLQDMTNVKRLKEFDEREEHE